MNKVLFYSFYYYYYYHIARAEYFLIPDDAVDRQSLDFRF